LSEAERAQMAYVLECSAIGAPETVKASIDRFIARTQADELILASHIYDHAARVRAYEIAAQVRGTL
jgi:alkanesulfonate monooxygenase SsuD/methylene tetrahydromethanopterin reductase-like flavin-dependent oxidoreductase (luciferase family)